MRRVASCCALALGMVAVACSSDNPTGGGAAGAGGASGSPAGGAGPSAGGAGASGAGASAGGASAGGPDAGGANAGAGAGGMVTGSSGAAGSAGGGGVAGGSAGAGGGIVVSDPGGEGDGKITVTNLTKQPELVDKDDAALKGREFNFTVTSKSYQYTEPWIKGTPMHQPRQVWVYVPKEYKDGTAAPFMVIQDGQQGSEKGGRYGTIRIALDNMTVSKDPARKIPAFIAIAIQDGGGDGPRNERGLEYDTISDRYGRFVQEEVLPAVVEDPELKAAFPNFKLTDNPEGRATFGCSSGAAAAFTMAWFHPEWFRRVVTYSGTFVALQNGQEPEAVKFPHGSWDYHSDLSLIANTDKKLLRVFNNANQNDNGATRDPSTRQNWLVANERMHTALEAKGYHNRYVYVAGVGHCDDRALRATLADTLVWVWRGYPTN